MLTGKINTKYTHAHVSRTAFVFFISRDLRGLFIDVSFSIIHLRNGTSVCRFPAHEFPSFLTFSKNDRPIESSQLRLLHHILMALQKHVDNASSKMVM